MKNHQDMYAEDAQTIPSLRQLKSAQQPIKSKKRTVTVPVTDVHTTADGKMVANISAEAVATATETAITPEQQTAVENKVEQQVEEKKLATEKKVKQIINNPSRTLFSATAVFPFDLFPDEIKIEETKVHVVNRIFFGSAQVQSLSFKDIKKVEVETSIFFAKIRLTIWTVIDNHVDISFLKKHEALKARRIIEGLKALSEQRVDLTTIPTHELLEKVENLGRIK